MGNSGHSLFSPRTLLLGQTIMSLCAIAALVLMPPAQGAMAIIPLPFANNPMSWVLQADTEARVLKRGPTANSLVITGRRNQILPEAIGHGALVIIALPILCGSLPKEIPNA